jgi:phenylalanyl-tRNA synthetase beta chain
MIITLNTLRLFLNFNDENIHEILNKLTYSGFEIDKETIITPIGKNLIIGKLLTIEKVENSDKLQICTVFDGSTNLQIICGGSDLQINKNYILAPINSQIGSLTIKEKKVCGLLSQGMLCGWEEIGINLEGMTLVDDHFIPGTPIENIYDLNFFQDIIYDIKVTPNRYDCLSVMGLIKEILSQNSQLSLKKNPISKVNPSLENNLDVKVETQECYAFYSTIIKNVNDYTPLWLKILLQNLGFKSINLPVDISNFLLVKYGYPTHCYNINSIEKCSIELVSHGNFLGLDNKDISINIPSIVLKNNGKIQCLMGIMGGKNSGYHGSGELVLEVANFNPDVIKNTNKNFHVNSRSSFLFSRWVDNRQWFLVIQDFISYLINPYYFIDNNIQNNNIIISNSKNHSDHIFNGNSLEIFLSYEDWFKISGYGLSIEKQLEYLNKLNIKSEFHKIPKGDDSNNYNIGILSQIPHDRLDITCKNNLVEEIIRMDNINQYESQFVSRESFQKPQKDEEIWIYQNIIRNILILYNYQEIITNIVAPGDDALKVMASPLALKSSLLKDLIMGAQKCIDRGLKKFNLFEVGTIFIDNSPTSLTKNNESESHSLAGLIYDFSGHQQNLFNECKYHLEILINNLNGLNKHLYYGDNDDNHHHYHPNKSCKIFYKNQLIGYMGVINHNILKETIVLWEINLDTLMELLDENVSPMPLNMKNIDISFFINGQDIHTIKNLIYKELNIYNIDIIDIYQTQDNCSYTLNIKWKYDDINDGDNHKMMEKISQLLKINNCIIR